MHQNFSHILVGGKQHLPHSWLCQSSFLFPLYLPFSEVSWPATGNNLNESLEVYFGELNFQNDSQAKPCQYWKKKPKCKFNKPWYLHRDLPCSDLISVNKGHLSKIKYLLKSMHARCQEKPKSDRSVTCLADIRLKNRLIN